MNEKNNHNRGIILAAILGALVTGIAVTVIVRLGPKAMHRMMSGRMQAMMARMKESGNLTPEMECCMQSCCCFDD